MFDIVFVMFATVMSILGTGDTPPAEDAYATSVFMAHAETALASRGETGYVLYEPFASGTFIGAVSYDSEASVGYWFSEDGTVEWTVSLP